MADQAGARWLSEEVLALAARAPIRGKVIGRFGTTLHADLGGFVAVVLPDRAPRMPNGLGIRGGLAGRDLPRSGAVAALHQDHLVVDRLTIEWDPQRPPRWDARVPRRSAACGPVLRNRAEAILGGASEDPDDLAAAALARIGADSRRDPEIGAGLSGLLASMRSADPELGAKASRTLVGRGPGLTPLGDDIVAAAGLMAASLNADARDGLKLDAWLAALVPADLRGRTTAISATLLELAVHGRGFCLAHPLIAPGPIGRLQLAQRLDAIQRFGHTTGAAYAAVIAAATFALPTSRCRSNPEPMEETR